MSNQPPLQQLFNKQVILGEQLRATPLPGIPGPNKADRKYLIATQSKVANSISYQASQFLRERNCTSAGQLRKVWHVITVPVK